MTETTLKELLEKVRVGKPTAFSLVDDLAGDGTIQGKRLVVEILDQRAEPPRRHESPARAHEFSDVKGFADYLLKYGNDDLVILADVAGERITAILDESSKQGREMVYFKALEHPFWRPWANVIGHIITLDAFISHLRNYRGSVVEPDARELLMAMSQIETRTEIKVHRGTGKKCLNGMLVKTTIQGSVREEIVELPDYLELELPIYVTRPAMRIKLDLNIQASKEGDVAVSMSCGDLVQAKFQAFSQILDEVRGLIGKGTFSFGKCNYLDWKYLGSDVAF